MKTIMRIKHPGKTFRSLVCGLMAAICLVVFAGSSLATGEAAPVEGSLIGSKVSRVFNGTLDSTHTMTTWEAAGQEDVP